MEKWSEQLDMAITSFIHASKPEIDQLKLHLVELDRKCSELEHSNATLKQHCTEQQNALVTVTRAQEEAIERISSTERLLEEHQSTMREQNRAILQLQTENATLKTAITSREPVINPDQPLPSREVTSDSQEFFSCADPSSPRSITFAGDEVSFAQLPAEWHNFDTSTPSSLRAAGNVTQRQTKRKRNVTLPDVYDSTGTFKVPQMPTRPSRSHKSRAWTAQSAHMNGLTAIAASNATDKTIPDDGSDSTVGLSANTPIKDFINEYDSSNIIVACRSGNVPKRTTISPTTSAVTDHVDDAQVSPSPENPRRVIDHVTRQGATNDLMPFDEMQGTYSNLLEQFHARTGEMQAGSPAEGTDSSASAEAIAFCRGKGGRLRKNPRKSAWLVRQEKDWDD